MTDGRADCQTFLSLCKMKEDIKKAIGHMSETHKIRKKFWHMDGLVDNLLYGIRQGDDSIIVGKTIVNMEGPYPLKIGRKTGLIHTCSDIVIMGGKPLYSLNSMQVKSIKQAEEIAEDLKKQSDALCVPIIGGNTQMESGLEPCISFTVIGELVRKAIPDCGAKTKDIVLMLGEIVEGSIGERAYRAKVKFNTFLDLIERGVEIHASKDCSRGGWFGNLAEMLIKSRKGIKIRSIPYPRITRYMGTYLVSIPESETKEVVRVAGRHRCPVIEVGSVTRNPEISLGDEVVVSKEEMETLIKEMPYKKPKQL